MRPFPGWSTPQACKGGSFSCSLISPLLPLAHVPDSKCGGEQPSYKRKARSRIL